jgi:hypothetical protein
MHARIVSHPLVVGGQPIDHEKLLTHPPCRGDLTLGEIFVHLVELSLERDTFPLAHGLARSAR